MLRAFPCGRLVATSLLTEEATMIFRQYYLGCLSQASYLIGDERTRTAVVVDPRRDVGEYVDDAARNGLTIKHVILTHFHADFVAGHLDCRSASERPFTSGRARRRTTTS